MTIFAQLYAYIMDYKRYIKLLGFIPKENTQNIYIKKYNGFDNYSIEIDFVKEIINYGDKIQSDNKTTQNFSQAENWVVLECVNRLIEKGYKPQNIILEKTWAAGHGTSGRLDICVTQDNGDEFLLIECKTWGKEFEKEYKRMKSDGGQLFTYFKFSNKADVIMLYASEQKGNEIISKNEIVKIEENYRTGDVKDFYEKWNKLTVNNGVFDSWVDLYNFKSKALTINELIDIKLEDSSFIFNRFLEILRHNVVSDKPNAFNKIFTLFLCKIYDEKEKEGTDKQLEFQWIEGKDNDIEFQLRLTDLYKKGMKEFLDKTVTDFSKEDFKNRYGNLDEESKKQLLKDFEKIRLEKNNEFAIKEVYDEHSFKENAIVVKQVVELLQRFKIRYAKKQQYLSDFFELLLTTGLKQESGQFFTPVPIAQFVLRSLPLDSIVKEKLKEGKRDELLPYVIDYAAGSGHFITESMNEIQKVINTIDTSNFKVETRKNIEIWRISHFDWALNYIYGIEKDYRLVKVGKVGCYLHGDGLANVIHSDGLAKFDHADYKLRLNTKDKDFSQENKQFDIVVSNPPYSVSSFKNTSKEYYTEKDFQLYSNLTDQSSEIECLFIERTKQLLKDGGIAGIILPSSILSNTGIYTKTREIILQNFEIIAITKLGSNTFMATGTNTIVLFLRRRNNYDCKNIQYSIEKFIKTYQDITINSIENPISKYVSNVWNDINFEDYVTLLHKNPNEKIKQNDIYKDYANKLDSNNKDFFTKVIAFEREKLLYFILAYPQQVVIVSSGEKNIEKQFLGYEFSNRRGSEGIHPIKRGKLIDDCTMLYDANNFINPQKASTYIYQAFNGDYSSPIDPILKDHITRLRLSDMITFDRADFEKAINITIKKKVDFEKLWESSILGRIGDVCDVIKGTSITKWQTIKGEIPVVAGGKDPSCFHNVSNREANIITVSASGANAGYVNYWNKPIFASDCNTIKSKDENKISTKLIYEYLQLIQDVIYTFQRGQAQPHVYGNDIENIKIPIPSFQVQQKIVNEINEIEKINIMNKIRIDELIGEKQKVIDKIFSDYNSKSLSELCLSVEYGSSKKSDKKGDIPVIRMGNIQKGKIDWSDLVYTSDKSEIEKYSLNYNDVLFNRTNSPELVGKVGIYKGEQPAIFAGYLIRIKYIKELINPIYLANILNSQRIREFGFSIMSKSIHQANINGSLLKTYKIPVAPIYEQNKISDKIDEFEREIEMMESEIKKSKELKNEILRKYL